MEPNGQNQSPDRIHLQWFADPPDNSGAGGEPQGGAAGAAAQGLFGESGKGGAGPSGNPAAGGPQGEGQEGKPGQGTDGNQPGQTPNPPALPGYAAGLTAKMKADAKAIQYASKFQSLDDLLRAGMELESKQGSLVRVPTEKDPPEVVAAYRKAMAIPNTPEEYKLEKVDGVPATAEEEISFRQMAHKYNMSQEAAASFWKDSLVKAKAIMDGARSAEAADIAAREKELEADWGTKLEENLEIARRGAAAYVKDDLKKALIDSDLATHPAVIRFFYELGLGTGEGTPPAGGGAGGQPKAQGFEYKGLRPN